jgi:hypothetical protein
MGKSVLHPKGIKPMAFGQKVSALPLCHLEEGKYTRGQEKEKYQEEK